MEFVATGCCTEKWLRLDRTLRDLTCTDLEIPPDGDSTGSYGTKRD